MKNLSPAKLGPAATWYRLARTSDGLLCVETISDAACSEALRVGGVEARERLEWAFCSEVPPHIARQLEDDNNPDQVARVLTRAMHLLGYR